MTRPQHNPRTPEAEVDCIFTDRWSPRSFLPEPLSTQQLQALFEAVRWAPSCFNEQPWLLLYAVSAADRARFVSTLVAKNQRWASSAPLLLYLLTRRTFAAAGRVNRHAAFDAGAAWMALALQARRLGLHAHAMAGFHVEQAREMLGVPEEGHEIMAAVAVGRRGEPAGLPEDLASIEAPNERKALMEVAFEGRFPAG